MEAIVDSKWGYTVDYIESLPDGQRAELIDGEIYDMATPSTVHQRLVSKLNVALSNHIASKGGDCEVFTAPFSVYLEADDRNYLEPDITVVCDKEKLDKKGCIGAPDLVIEITSPSTIKRDYGVKLFKYRSAGVREYWVINPDLKNVTVNVFDVELGEDHIGQFSFDEDVSFALYPDLSVRLSGMAE